MTRGRGTASVVASPVLVGAVTVMVSQGDKSALAFVFDLYAIFSGGVAGLFCLAAAQPGVPASRLWLELGALAALVIVVPDLVLGRRSETSAAPRESPTPDEHEPCVGLVISYGLLGFGYILPATFLPALAREVGFLLYGELRLAQRSRTVGIETCPSLDGFLLRALQPLVLSALELGLPALEAPLGLTLQPGPRFTLRVVVRTPPARPPFLGLAHGALVLCLPARPTLIGFGDGPLLHLRFGAGVLGFPVLSALLGLPHRA